MFDDAALYDKTLKRPWVPDAVFRDFLFLLQNKRLQAVALSVLKLLDGVGGNLCGEILLTLVLRAATGRLVMSADINSIV